MKELKISHQNAVSKDQVRIQSTIEQAVLFTIILNKLVHSIKKYLFKRTSLFFSVSYSMPDLKLLTLLLLMIRLKKSKQQYNVASKSAYVITVELLDNVNIECTLTAESTGKITFQHPRPNYLAPESR